MTPEQEAKEAWSKRLSTIRVLGKNIFQNAAIEALEEDIKVSEASDDDYACVYQDGLKRALKILKTVKPK